MYHFNKTFFFLFLILILAVLLRFTWLSDKPPSLYTDEINQGYNAYSIFKTGRDEHGTFLPVSLRSFGDWKPPLPAYLMIPFISLLGPTEEAIRLPSAVLGTLTVLLIYFLVKELLIPMPYTSKPALLSAFFLTVSPWHVLESRAAMLVAVGLFFLVSGVYLFIKGIRNHTSLILSSLFFALSLYSYYGFRIITPLIVLVLFFLYRQNIKHFAKLLVIPAVLGLILLLPLFFTFLKEPNVIFGRAKTVSIFYDQGVKLRQWELITQDGVNSDSLISRFYHNNFSMYTDNAFERFLSHFDGQYLFFSGDHVPPFQIPHMGIFYLIDSILLIGGLISLFQQKKQSTLIISWLIISIIPAAFTFITPSSNRTFNAVIPMIIIIALGLTRIFARINHRLLGGLIISILYAMSFGYFLKQYFLVLPKDHANWWNYGWKETVRSVGNIKTNYDYAVISDTNGMPYIYFLFYNRYDPIKYQHEAVRTYVSDQYGYEHIEGFQKYLFPNGLNWKYEKENPRKNSLYVIPASEAPDDNDFIKAIYYPDGKIAFKIFMAKR